MEKKITKKRVNSSAVQRCMNIIENINSQKKEVDTKRKVAFFGKNILLEKELIEDIHFVLDNINYERLFEQREFMMLFSFFKNMAEAMRNIKDKNNENNANN